jgi:hypothetical protein
MPQILNPDMYNKAKEDADKKYKKPSAYKSMYIVKRYKELGGEYADDGKPKNLDRWRKEEWKDVAGLDYPVYRPTKKISKSTPLTPAEIEPENLVKQSILKQVVKGSKNLPPFKSVGGKRTAKEIKDFLEASYQEEPPEELEGFVLDKSLSTDTAKVYYNPTSNEAVVAHRGTKGMLDWGNNLAYALGYYNYTPRYKKGKSVQDKAEAKYGKSNISTLGHSQGAILSRKLGADTKEVINVNPAWMGEKPYKNEYNIRSSTDIVSGLYAPISTARSLLYPKYTLKHDILVPSKSSSDILGEHSYNILERLGDKEIGVGAENKISNNNIMKGGRRFSLDEKIKQLVYIGLPQEAVALLLHSGNLENVWNTYISGEDMTPVLSGVLSSIEPRKTRGSKFDLNAVFSKKDEDPSNEVDTSDPIDVNTGNIDTDPTDDDLVGGMKHYPYGYYNVGTNPIGVIGGAMKGGATPQEMMRSIHWINELNRPLPIDINYLIEQLINAIELALDFPNSPHIVEDANRAYTFLLNDVRRRGLRYDPSQTKPSSNMKGGKVKNPFKSVSKAFKPVGKALDTAGQALGQGAIYANPMMWALSDKGTSQAMAKSGEITHDYLLPAVVSAGKPIYDATAITASTMLTGNPVLGKAVADTLWNEMVAKKGADPRQNQKSKELGDLSGFAGKAVAEPYSASLGGMGRKKTKKSQEQILNEMSRLYAHFKQQNPKSRVKDVMGFAKKMIRDKPNKKIVDFSKVFIKEFK